MTEAGRRYGQLSQLSVSELHGVGPAKAEALASIGIHSVLDLLFHYPRRYIDRTRQTAVAEIEPGESAMVLATVERVAARRTRNGRSLVEVTAADASGSLKITFFNQPWRTKQLLPDTEAVFVGKVDSYRAQLQMTNPVVDLIGDQTNRIVPVYPQSEKAKLVSREISAWVAEALRRAGELADPVPQAYRQELGLGDRTWAMNQVHQPEEMSHAYGARKRLAFDELLRLQTLLVLRRAAIEADALGISHNQDSLLVKQFLSELPFAPTRAQNLAIAEIANDMAKSVPMHRLLQGDVGSGKTVVAVAAMLSAVEGHFQAALMAPTEVLAEQHYINIKSMLKDLVVPDNSLLGQRPVSVALLTGRVPAAQRRQLHHDLKTGALDILVGTHALLVEDVTFKALGAVVVDEQHRFGVEQRSLLRDKGPDGRGPDVLVMTATPIPRTAAMTVYGDLEVSTLDELPPGRTPIKTKWVQTAAEQQKAWQRLRQQVEAGQQAYVVCALVEASEKIQAKSAVSEYERLAEDELAGLRLGLLHGQMSAADKESVMNQFRAASIDVLVATTVIEVGVDVPNASVMIIQDATRFGIAQLHQLRGRVGRGAAQSYCFLLGEAANDDASQRLMSLQETTDGFELAEVDLELRGAGSIMGARQSGRSDLKLATLKRSDRQLVAQARKVATDLVSQDTKLRQAPILVDDVSRLIDETEAEFLFRG